MITILSAAALAIAPPVTAESPAKPVLYEVAPNVWSDQPGPLLTPKPPTAEEWTKHGKCFKRMRWFRRGGQAVDGIVSAGMVASGAAKELNPLLSWGGAPAIIGVKLLSNVIIDSQTNKLMAQGRYKQACDLEKISFALSFGWLGVLF